MVDENTLHYRFSLALQVRHPNLRADVWTKALRTNPVRSWDVGEPRTTPTGRKLVGAHRASYGCWDLAEGRGEALIGRLSATTKRLAKHKALVRRWRTTGGRVAYYLVLSGQRTIPVELPPELLAAMGELGVELGIEVLTENH
jgi:Domain of unknown function (DUF4279)